MNDIDVQLKKIRARQLSHSEKEYIWQGVRAKKSETVSLLELVRVRFMTGAIIAIFLLLAGGGVVAASDNAKPGDALYSIDMAAERVEFSLAKDKTAVAHRIAEERVQEAEHLSKKQQEPSMNSDESSVDDNDDSDDRDDFNQALTQTITSIKNDGSVAEDDAFLKALYALLASNEIGKLKIERNGVEIEIESEDGVVSVEVENDDDDDDSDRRGRGKDDDDGDDSRNDSNTSSGAGTSGVATPTSTNDSDDDQDDDSDDSDSDSDSDSDDDDEDEDDDNSGSDDDDDNNDDDEGNSGHGGDDKD